MALPYLYRWNRQGRKGQPCDVLVRGKMNSCLVRFADGYTMVTSQQRHHAQQGFLCGFCAARRKERTKLLNYWSG